MKDRTNYTAEQWDAMWARWERRRNLPYRQMNAALTEIRQELLGAFVPFVEWINRLLSR